MYTRLLFHFLRAARWASKEYDIPESRLLQIMAQEISDTYSTCGGYLPDADHEPLDVLVPACIDEVSPQRQMAMSN